MEGILEWMEWTSEPSILDNQLVSGGYFHKKGNEIEILINPNHIIVKI